MLPERSEGNGLYIAVSGKRPSPGAAAAMKRGPFPQTRENGVEHVLDVTEHLP